MNLEVPGSLATRYTAPTAPNQTNRPGGTITASHYTTASSNAKIANDEVINYKFGDDIYSNRNVITGYTYSSTGGSWDALGTVETGLAHNNDGTNTWQRVKNACNWTSALVPYSGAGTTYNKTVVYYYNPKTYKVTYDLGTTTNIGWTKPSGTWTQSGNTYYQNSSATFDANYTLGAAPIRPGYTSTRTTRTI